MITFQKTVSLPGSIQQNLPEHALFLDIETTGLSPRRAFVYCIGLAKAAAGPPDADEYTAENLQIPGESTLPEFFLTITQYFAENSSEEQTLLAALLQTLTEKQRTLITYNGTAFDLPFLEKRCSLYGLCPEFSGLSHLDLLREFRPLKSLLSLSRMRQKDLESFCGISREDRFDGGRLIEVYHSYVRSGDPALLALLQLHNFEDMKGMAEILPVLSFRKLQKGDFSVDRMYMPEILPDAGTARMNIRITYETLLPKTPVRTDGPTGILLKEKEGALSFPVFFGTRYYYFPDYKNYYYLPEEDTAIHKSVGQFVDPAHRIPAGRETCRVKKSGWFLPLETTLPLPAFRDGSPSGKSLLLLSGFPDEAQTGKKAFLTEQEAKILKTEICGLLT